MAKALSCPSFSQSGCHDFALTRIGGGVFGNQDVCIDFAVEGEIEILDDRNLAGLMVRRFQM